MVKAHSLLYAIYICLIVSIICGALLYFSNLYNQLNGHYKLSESLYISNQSVVNFALGNQMMPEEMPQDSSGITGSYEARPYGLLTLLLARSVVHHDTVSSAHFAGGYAPGKTALFLANMTRPLGYSGKVTFNGDISLPSTFIETAYLPGKFNLLTVNGKKELSPVALPEINSAFKKIFEGTYAEKASLGETERPVDSVYYNSFFNPTKEINFSGRERITVKGNFILRSKDSIRIHKNAILEDVILIAPKITFEAGFKGTVQAFATKGIAVGENTSLNYPSVLCVYNDGPEESKIAIGKACSIDGAVVLFGNSGEAIQRNSVEIEEGGLITGDIYCTGKLMLKSNVHGSVYANQVFYKAVTSLYENLLCDVEINALKRPAYYIALPLFDAKKTVYGLIKKVL